MADIETRVKEIIAEQLKVDDPASMTNEASDSCALCQPAGQESCPDPASAPLHRGGAGGGGGECSLRDQCAGDGRRGYPRHQPHDAEY